jgi:hypothetical protein
VYTGFTVEVGGLPEKPHHHKLGDKKMGKVDIGYKYEALVTSADQFLNIQQNSSDKVILALPKQVLNNLISQFENQEEAISYDSYGKVIEFDHDLNDYQNNLLMAIFEGQKMPTTYEVTVAIRVEAEDEGDAEYKVQNALDMVRGIDEFDINEVCEY